jgi:hypothetical protein
VFDLATEDPISLTQAARLLPPGRGGRPVTLSCLLRWLLRGARGPDGKLVRLEALRIGGRWVTSRAALQRFAERLTPRLEDDQASPRTATAGRRASLKAGKQLEAMGIG